VKKIRRLLPYVWPHRGGLTVVLVTLLFGVCLDVLLPWPIKILVDNILGPQPLPPWAAGAIAYIPGASNPSGLVAWLAFATILLHIAHNVLAMISTTAFVSLGQRMVYDLGADLFLHLQKMSLRFHGKQQVGDLVARVTVDTYCVQTFVSSILFPLMHSGLTLVSVFWILWTLEPSMAVLALWVVPLLGILIRLFGKAMEDAAIVRSDLDARMMSLVEQTLIALPAVQAFAREESEHQRFQECADATVAAHRRSASVDMTFKLLVGLVTAAATAGILWLGATRALEGRITTGTILLFLAYISALYQPINTIVYSTATWQSISAHATRVLEMLDTPADVAEAKEPLKLSLKGAVEFESVCFEYEKDQPILSDICFKAKSGEVLAIVGPTGAGKTTMLSLLVRFFDPDSGRVLVDGNDVRNLKIVNLREQVAMVLQDPFLFPMSVADNISYGKPGASHEEVIAAAQAANADEFIRRMPNGYDTVIGERGVTLSGGERQRLSIARAFLKDAPILILDEPTSALDALTEKHLLDALERLTIGRTTFIIAHRLSTIRRASRILVLERGRLVEQGTHEELFDAGGLYSMLYRVQSTATDSLNIVSCNVPAHTQESGLR
jgi:ATP-binding cassette, subfamily B, bacterial